MKFLNQLLGAFGGKKKKKKRKGTGKAGGQFKAKRKPVSKPAVAAEGLPTSAPDPALAPEPLIVYAEPRSADPGTLDEFIDQMVVSPTPPPAAEPAPEPVELEAIVPAPDPVANELSMALRDGDWPTVERLTAPARALGQAAQDKHRLFASYEAQLDRAIGVRDFMTLAFVGSSLIIDAAFFRDDLLGQATRLSALADQARENPRKVAAELSTLLETFEAGVAKKQAMLETLSAKIIKAHQARDFGTLSDLTSALSRDALILSSLDAQQTQMEASDQTGLTATSSSEKAAQIDQQVAQLHKAILDRAYPAIADIARIVSLNSGVLSDPSTSKAAQILQLGQQLQGAMRAAQENPANAAMCTNLGKVASVFNGPLMDKANQLESQVNQLQAALKSLDQNKMFTLSVTIARSAAILTDATIQKASLLAGYVPRIDSSLKRKDFTGATNALKSALS